MFVNLNVMSNPDSVVTISKDFGNGNTRTTDDNGFCNFGVEQGALVISSTGLPSRTITVGNADITVDLRPVSVWPPKTLTLGADGNNSPYGVTLAGWSPQDHQGIDLTDPSNSKYLLYAYLVINKIQPTNNWAVAAAFALQQVMPQSNWQPYDSETLQYDGDQYVHTAPNGYGMNPGTFNMNANPVEFLVK